MLDNAHTHGELRGSADATSILAHNVSILYLTVVVKGLWLLRWHALVVEPRCLQRAVKQLTGDKRCGRGI
jgi:hypothetical protein